MTKDKGIQDLRIGDIMIPLDGYPCVAADATLAEAMDVLATFQIDFRGQRSLPRVLLVFDVGDRLLGTVRRRDIMRALEPQHLVSRPLEYRKKLFDVAIDPNLTELSYDRIVTGIVANSRRPVRAIARPIDVALDVDDHIMKGIYEMVSYGLTLLPVRERGRVVGVVRTVELFGEVHRLVRGASPADSTGAGD
jgi:CBS domain-containing protein